MSAPQATDRLGTPVPTPAHITPQVWARITRSVVMLPAGCHIWTGPPRSDGYGQMWIPEGAITAVPAVDAQPALFDIDEHQDDEDAEPQGPGTRRGRPWRAHRAAHAALTGVLLDPGVQLMHRCDQPLCTPILATTLNAHLAAGTHGENTHDRDHKGRTRIPAQSGRTRWARGGPRGPYRRATAIHDAVKAILNQTDAGRLDTHTTLTHIAAVVGTGHTEDLAPTLF